MLEKKVNLSPINKLQEADIQPGLVIEGFPNVESLDTLVETLRDVIAETNFPPEQQEAMKKDRSAFLKPVSVGLRPRNFNGRLLDLKVEILPPDVSFVKESPENVRPDSAINFLAGASMHSSGKGISGKVEKEFVLYVRDRRSGAREGLYPHIMMSSRKVTDATKQVEQIKKESSENATRIWRAGLQKVISAGLPTLGKRK